MPSVPAGACLGQSLATARRQRERVVQFAISEQSAIGGDHRTAEPKHQAAVEIEPQRAPVRFTRRVRHRRPVRSRTTCCILYDNQDNCAAKYGIIREIRDKLRSPCCLKTVALFGNPRNERPKMTASRD